MTIVPTTPGQNGMPPKDWFSDRTLVDERNQFHRRIMRFLRNRWLWLVLGIIGLFALLDPAVMTGLISILGLALQLSFAIAFILVQFIFMYSFVSRTRMYTIMPGAEGVSFDDYRGQPEVLEQAQQIVMLLRGVKEFEGAGGEPLNGLLMEGPPGTGKTWLAQAISTEAGVPFFYVDTSSLQAMFMGVGTMKVARVYGRARRAAQQYGAAVIFFDEIDAIGARGGVSEVGGGIPGLGGTGGMGGMMGGGDMGLLSTMLIEMSGFSLEHGWRARLRTWFYKTFLRRLPPKPEKRVMTIGATNRVAAMDPALLRPGRFDKKIRIDAPDMVGRQDIFSYYLSKISHDETMSAVILSSDTPGYTPADIKYLLNESLRYALFEGRDYITYRDFQMAQPEHENGLRAPLKHMSVESRKRIAYHEAGHAVGIRLFMPKYRISRITIIRQGRAFGYVKYHEANEAHPGLMNYATYMNLLRVAVAGKAAEIEFCGLMNQTLGVGGDFAMIRGLLFRMALAGMFGPLAADMSIYAGKINPELSARMEEVFQQVLRETRLALREHRPVVQALVDKLMVEEEILADGVKAFFDGFGLETPVPALILDDDEIQLVKEVLDGIEDVPQPAAAGGK